MIDRLGSPAGHQPAHVEKPRQTGRGFSDWLEQEQRAGNSDGDAMPSDASVSPNATDAAGASDASNTSATAMLVEQGARFPDVEIELRRATGELEMISLPWKLAANGRLSHRLLEQVRMGLGGHDAVAGMSQALRHAPAYGSTRAWLAPVQEWRQPGGSGGLFQQPASAAMDVESVDASSPGATRSWAAMPWLVRLFRWLEQKGHDPAIWLRDYRLDQADAHQLAQALRAHANEQGIRLERIVVNGREQWRAPSATPRESSDAR